MESTVDHSNSEGISHYILADTLHSGELYLLQVSEIRFLMRSRLVNQLLSWRKDEKVKLSRNEIDRDSNYGKSHNGPLHKAWGRIA